MPRLSSFLALVFLLSAPLWIAARFLDATAIIPIRLPLSALQFVSVLLAATIATRSGRGSVPALLARGLDLSRVDKPVWRVGIFVLMPLAVAASYALSGLFGDPHPTDTTPLASVPALLLIYGVSGYCEQLGWTAIMTDALLEHGRTTVQVGLITGTTWASWHIIPFIQTHNPPSWIAWQCTFTVIYRVLLTKIYLLTNYSVFATIALHATYNTAFTLLPYYGSSYDPLSMAITTLALTVCVFVTAGRKTGPAPARPGES